MFKNAKKRNVNVIIQGDFGECSPEEVAEKWEAVKEAESKCSTHAQHSEELVEKLRDWVLS
jgi:hypothetical protein